MTKTLYVYISRELVRVTGLALVAFTLVLTVGAIMEPLRSEGLAGADVAALFAYTLPVMLSLTLPIGALFAATIVYGRFSQDNEMLACRASGISTLALLKPALVLALVVTAASLALSNFAAPAMAERADKGVKANIRSIAYNQLRSRKYIHHEIGRDEEFAVYADRVLPGDILQGVVLIRVKGSGGKEGPETLVGTSARTKVTFFEKAGESYAAFDALYVSGGPLDKYHYAQERRQPCSIRIPNPVKEKPSWYSWGKLNRVIERPELDPRVARKLRKIKQAIAHDRFCEELIGAINTDGAFELAGGGALCLVLAGTARAGKGDTVNLYPAEGKSSVLVVLWTEDMATAAWRASGALTLLAGPAGAIHSADVLRITALPRIATAKKGVVEAASENRYGGSIVRVRLVDGASVMVPIHGWRQPEEWGRRFELPKRFAREVRHINLDNVGREAARLSGRKDVRSRVKSLTEIDVPAVKGKLVGEKHGRLAYGVSCFLLVALGAALGLIFRGGQLLSAFATAVEPAAFVIILVLTGKQLAHNSQVPLAAGLAVIWGGVAALAAACLLVYLYLCRR
ncbi:MAG: LptF/LptG family permease [Planctomycetota bacterium]